MFYLRTDKGGARRITSHPGWRSGATDKAGALLTDAELAARGIYAIVDEPPEFDPETQKRTIAPIKAWPIRDGMAVKQYVVADLTPAEIERGQQGRAASQRADEARSRVRTGKPATQMTHDELAARVADIEVLMLGIVR